MERKIVSFFQKWKKDIIRKPLILYGPKQIGKTFTALEFGKNEYKNVVYFNTANNKNLIDLFKREKSPDKLIVNLSVISGETILEDDSLIIFDNVDSIEIVKGLKLFGSETRKYHIIAIHQEEKTLKILKEKNYSLRECMRWTLKNFYGLEMKNSWLT